MKILAIPGSLRSHSKNAAVLQAIASLVSGSVVWQMESQLGELPHFNPDLDELDRNLAPEPVLSFRARLRAVDAVVVSSPEYAHGIASVLKNALEWLVGSGEFVAMPTMVVNVSPTSTFAHASLLEVLRTMEARVRAITLPVAVSVAALGSSVDAASYLNHPVLSEFLRTGVDEFVASCR